MNYLAHLRLAGDDPECLTGNFLGDFVKGKLYKGCYTPGIRRGIMMHRRIDAWTDSHKITKECTRLISTGRRRWSRVILDIFYDHLLAVNWEKYSDNNLEDFLEKAYGIILGAADMFPEGKAARIKSIVEGGWIDRYSTISGLSVVFDVMSRRIKRENPLYGSEQELVAHYNELEWNFNQFFPEIIEYARYLEKADDAESRLDLHCCQSVPGRLRR